MQDAARGHEIVRRVRKREIFSTSLTKSSLQSHRTEMGSREREGVAGEVEAGDIPSSGDEATKQECRSAAAHIQNALAPMPVELPQVKRVPLQVGSNAVVVKDVPPGTTAVGNPARIIDGEQAQKREEKAGQMGFSAYAVTRAEDDPLALAIHGLLDHAVETDRRIDLLLKKLESTGVCLEDEIATADKFDPKYLSKIVD